MQHTNLLHHHRILFLMFLFFQILFCIFLKFQMFQVILHLFLKFLSSIVYPLNQCRDSYHLLKIMSNILDYLKKGPMGFEPTAWWSEATRSIQAELRVQKNKHLTGLNICLSYENIKKSCRCGICN